MKDQAEKQSKSALEINTARQLSWDEDDLLLSDRLIGKYRPSSRRSSKWKWHLLEDEAVLADTEEAARRALWDAAVKYLNDN